MSMGDKCGVPRLLSVRGVTYPSAYYELSNWRFLIGKLPGRYILRTEDDFRSQNRIRDRVPLIVRPNGKRHIAAETRRASRVSS
jgi:hypothetical protein